MKRYTVVFSPLALDDIEQTVEYYQKQQAGLGNRFAAQLQLTLNANKRNPFFASVRYDDPPQGHKEIPISRALSHRRR